jgi:hypothetical protein
MVYLYLQSCGSGFILGLLCECFNAPVQGRLPRELHYGVGTSPLGVLIALALAVQLHALYRCDLRRCESFSHAAVQHAEPAVTVVGSKITVYFNHA